MTDFAIDGADQFLKLSKALKEAGHANLRKELNKGMRDASKPLIKAARAEALRRLPSRGGLAARIAKAPQRVQTRTGADPGVRIVVGANGLAARTADSGTVRHPVFGNKTVWVVQPVRSGWFSDPMEAGAPVVRRNLEDALEQMAAKVVREFGVA